MAEAKLRTFPKPIRDRVEKVLKVAPKTDYSVSALGPEEEPTETVNIDTKVNRWLQNQITEAISQFGDPKLANYSQITSIDACMALMPHVVAIITDTVALWNGVQYTAHIVRINDLLALQGYFKDKKILLHSVKIQASVDVNTYQPGYCYQIKFAEI
jgi:polyribonucleotide nucleotidyltransferase